LQEIRTASNTVLVAFFTSDTTDVFEVNIENKADWKINGVAVTQIFRYATQANVCDHHIYLRTSTLINGKDYFIETPYGNLEFQFNERKILCESIKTNQVGYSALSKIRYANFAIWLGTGGSKEIEGPLPDYEVFELHTDQVIAKGTLQDIGHDTSSGDFVYRINLSSVPEGGPYKIVLKGYGSSYPFGIGGEFSKRLAYTIFRAQYLQRCGCPISKPDIRKKACHTLVYDVDGPIGEANIVVEGSESTFTCYGGYHDAGDADRRAYHMLNPIINLMVYEAFPETFYDGQYDIPGEFDENYNIVNYTNGIPDILDEAEWGTLIWEYLQNEDGSVHFGTETKGYPDPFAAPMDQDNKKYGTVKTDPRATCTAAGLFLHLARLLKPYKPERSAELIQRAEKAMIHGADDMANPEKLYYYIQYYLLTEDEKAHEKVKELYFIADSLKYHSFATQGYSLNDERFDNPAYIFSYIMEQDVPTDPVIEEYFIGAIESAADSNITELEKYAYPVGNNSGQGGWGHNVKQAKYACAPLLYWRLFKEQKYLDAASQLMDYKLGLNPVGISYVTGLGFHQVHNPHDRECAYTMSKGWGPKPGITVFGPGIISWWRKSEVLPATQDLPKERQFVDDIRAISFTEFTIFETQTYDALYTVLSGAGKWNGEDPFVQLEE
ncbi:MAG: glycoside hydrolase family 9 protein, partial [Flavobacteriaceae bacterium]|nr:glycoside hydrolase family 9 protein [Eudoraea sp.]NNJ38438.1 glycoside hydrolase family 9 protein [Flavobacteriaceae bacterium]